MSCRPAAASTCPTPAQLRASWSQRHIPNVHHPQRSQTSPHPARAVPLTRSLCCATHAHGRSFMYLDNATLHALGQSQGSNNTSTFGALPAPSGGTDAACSSGTGAGAGAAQVAGNGSGSSSGLAEQGWGEVDARLCSGTGSGANQTGGGGGSSGGTGGDVADGGSSAGGTLCSAAGGSTTFIPRDMLLEGALARLVRGCSKWLGCAYDNIVGDLAMGCLVLRWVQTDAGIQGTVPLLWSACATCCVTCYVHMTDITSCCTPLPLYVPTPGTPPPPHTHTLSSACRIMYIICLPPPPRTPFFIPLYSTLYHLESPQTKHGNPSPRI